MINIKEIPYEIAYRAWYNISFSPEDRGRAAQKEFKEHMDSILNKISNDTKEEYSDLIQYYFDKKYDLYINWLRKMSNCFSVMITGPSGFNNRRHEKANNAEKNALKEYCDYDILKRLFKKIKYIEKRKETEKREENFDIIFENDSTKLINNRKEERIQFIFDGKPSEEIRNILKGNAFKWAPSAGAWQRKNTPNGICAANLVLKKIECLP